MRLWVKICGATSLDDARLAVEAGADAVGFVFAASPRRVTVEQVAALVPHLPAELEKMGVFVHAGVEEIHATVQACGLTGVQLHNRYRPGVAMRLRDRLGQDLRIVQVIHFSAEACLAAQAAAADAAVSAVLIDSRAAGAEGGTGLPFDWQVARSSILSRIGALKPVVVAGGLHPANVAEAIRVLMPWGVDVVTGVEAAPGKKDRLKVMEFVERARKAHANRA